LAGGRAFVTDQYGGTVTVFDASSLAVLKTIPVGEYPEGIAASRDGRRVYVANWFSDTLSIIDAETLAVVGTAAVGAGPRAFGTFIR
jgi:YVTN family beta-propeller protein